MVLLMTTLLTALILAHFLGPNLTHAINKEQDMAGTMDTQTAGQSDDKKLANCRYGVTSNTGQAHIIPKIGAGVFYRWEADWPTPLPENGAELLRMIRPRQRKTSSGQYLPYWYTKVRLNDDLAEIIRSDPGAVWLIGNEPERGPNPGETYTPRTDDIHAGIYAEAYHEIYHFIKSIDPTARIANAGLIQITPTRLQYLDMMWDAYERKFGVPMPVDVWTTHAYVLPELTADGEPNNIASIPLGTDLAFGKRGSGGDLSKCVDPDVYCKVEHDDPSLLEKQVVSMRKWMKDHGQQNKPLIVTEYGTLYMYRVKENGSCGIRDENGECFSPERVSKFMLESFDYFNNARDPDLGLPTDDDKLVQQWIWYGAWNWDVASADLLLNDQKTLSLMGETFRDHVHEEPTYLNLIVDDVAGTVVSQDGNDTATAQLSVSFRNNGNSSVEKPFTVTFYKDAALTKPIGSSKVTANIGGCATEAFSIGLEWEIADKGTHQFWVKLDSNNILIESDKSDNVGSGQLSITGPIHTLDVQIISKGDGVGGTVSTTPVGPTHAKGTTISLSAVPYSGWSFVGWKGAIIGNAPQATVSMNDDLTIEAHFEQDQYEIVVDISGDGQVTIDPNQDYYLYRDQITLFALPAPGWRFVEWRGDIEEGSPTIKLLVDRDVHPTAVFEELVADFSDIIFNPIILGSP